MLQSPFAELNIPDCVLWTLLQDLCSLGTYDQRQLSSPEHRVVADFGAHHDPLGTELEAFNLMLLILVVCHWSGDYRHRQKLERVTGRHYQAFR